MANSITLRRAGIAILAAVAAIALALSCGAGKAWAGGGGSIDYLDKNKTVYVSYLGKDLDLGVRGYGDAKSIAKEKSSNTQVATVAVYKTTTGGTWYNMVVTLKRPGATKLSYTHAGKKHAVNYVIKKYANPIKAFKIGAKNYASLFTAKKMQCNSNGSYSAATPAKAFNGKMKITPAAGWKVNSIHTSTSAGIAKLKNGSKLKATTFLQVEMKNKKTGQLENFLFSAMGDYYKYFKQMLKAA